MFLRGCEFMLFCNNLYLFCWKMSKSGFKFLWRLSNSNALVFFIILAFLNYIYQSIHLNAFGLINTLFYSLNNKKDILNDWKNVKKTCFSILFFIFSLKKIGYILKIHNFAPSRIHQLYEYFKKWDIKSLKKSKREAWKEAKSART